MRQAAGHLVLVRHQIAGLQLGVKEKALPHFGQKPSVRPGCPSRDRPTGEPQFGQFRFSSGTCGFFMIAWAASITGAGGTRVSPAPSRADRSRLGARAHPFGDLGTIAGGPLGAERGRLQPAGASGDRRAEAAVAERRLIIAGRLAAGGCGRAAADVAVAVDDRAGAAGLRAGRAIEAGRRGHIGTYGARRGGGGARRVRGCRRRRSSRRQ